MKKVLSSFVFFLFCFQFNFSQTKETGSISGFVYDNSSGESLLGANVYLKELKSGCITNNSGYFVIPNIPTGEYTLICSFIGYKTHTQKVKINNGEDKNLEITLEVEAVLSREVIITAESGRMIEKLFAKPISSIDIYPGQIGKVPQLIESDLLRSLQTIPGILSISDFSSDLFVRGGTPDQNLFLIDGADVYNPEHLFGLFSTFNTDAIKKVEISKGGFGAEYGGRLSSVINVINLDGNRNKIEGSIGISLLSAKASIQAPLFNFGSISGSIRRTYFDQTVGKFINESPNYYFLDGNLKAFLDINDKNKITLSFFSGRDKLDDFYHPHETEHKEVYYDWGNTTASINWKTIINPQLFGNFWLTFSDYTSHLKFFNLKIFEDNLIRDITLKGILEYSIMNDLSFKFGFEQKNLHVALNQDFPNGKMNDNQYRKSYALYCSALLKPDPLWEIETGLRYDYFSSDKGYQNLDPRFSVKYRLSESTNLKFATGIYHQYIYKIPREFFMDLWVTADKNIKSSKSYHYILGIQNEVWKDYSLEIETYYKKYKDISSFNQLYLLDASDGFGDLFHNPPVLDKTLNYLNIGNGYSYGLEILFKKDVGPITGWIGYSLSRTKYLIDGINQGNSFLARHDRTSVINVVANFDINRLFDEIFSNEPHEHSSRWILGLNFIYATGQPITIPSSGYYINNYIPGYSLMVPNSLTVPGTSYFTHQSISLDTSKLFIHPTEINNYRLPDYIRMDISLTYEKNYGSWSIAPYLQIINAGNRKNIWYIDYGDYEKTNGINLKGSTIGMMPILPSIGVNIKF
jgi:outer membrane cobalamin receptor